MGATPTGAQAFYDACDEYGILLYHDLQFTDVRNAFFFLPNIFMTRSSYCTAVRETEENAGDKPRM